MRLFLRPATAAVLAAGILIGLAAPAGAEALRGRAIHKAAHPGELVWARILTGTAALPSGAANYDIEYVSSNNAGQPVPVAGTVAIPRGTPPRGGGPVSIWAPRCHVRGRPGCGQAAQRPV